MTYTRIVHNKEFITFDDPFYNGSLLGNYVYRDFIFLQIRTINKTPYYKRKT